jgi:O-antigen ligase
MPNSSMSATDPTSVTPATPSGWRWAPVWVLAYVALWPAPGYAEGVLVLGALAAIIKLVATRFRDGTALLTGPAWALTTVLFCAYWLPELVSAVDAIDPARALREAVVDLRYLPFLWLVALAVADPRGRRITFAGLAVIVAIWTIDALMQAMSGSSPLFSAIDGLKRSISGHGMCSPEEVSGVDRLSGILGPCNLKLGQVIASLSPFALYAAGRRFATAGWLVAAGAVGVVVLLAGSRASWITYALVLLLSGWRLLGWRKLAIVFAFGAINGQLGCITPRRRCTIASPARRMRCPPARRVSTVPCPGARGIWSAALCMARTHPINGVGARGFREAFPACDPGVGQMAAWGEGPALHAHQLVLEVLSETGLFGILLWLAGIALAWRAWRFAGEQARERARPAMLALVVTVFPFNTHLAFYSTFWGGLTLLLAALYAGSLLGARYRVAGRRLAAAAAAGVLAIGRGLAGRSTLEAPVDPQVLRRRLAHHRLDRCVDAAAVVGRVRGREVLQRRAQSQHVVGALAAVEERHHRAAAEPRELVGGGDGCGRHAEERREHRVLAAHVLVRRVPQQPTLLEVAHRRADLLVGEHRAGVAQAAALDGPFHHRVAMAAVHAGQRDVVAHQAPTHLQCHEVPGYQQHSAALARSGAMCSKPSMRTVRRIGAAEPHHARANSNSPMPRS